MAPGRAKLCRPGAHRTGGQSGASDFALSSDRLLAIFDGPSRAIRSAQSIVHQATSLGVTARSGLHTGECTLIAGEPRGLPLETAAWVMSQARAGEILASSTVRDLVPGSGIAFDEAGVRDQAPAPGGSLRLYRVESSQPSTRRVRAPQATMAESLTRREREVVALLARGRTNREIADTLVISERTVENHVSNVLGKLSLETRAQVAIWTLSRDDARTLVSA